MCAGYTYGQQRGLYRVDVLRLRILQSGPEDAFFRFLRPSPNIELTLRLCPCIILHVGEDDTCTHVRLFRRQIGTGLVQMHIRRRFGVRATLRRRLRCRHNMVCIGEARQL